MSDINQDGLLDLIIGNDFVVPDTVLLGRFDNNEFHFYLAEDLFPYTTKTTMSIDSADINNDLTFDLLWAQISGNSMSSDLVKLAQERSCERLMYEQDKQNCYHVQEMRQVSKLTGLVGESACLSLAFPLDQGDCIAFSVYRKIYNPRTPLSKLQKCTELPSPWISMAETCVSMQTGEFTKVESTNGKPKQKAERNILYSLEPFSQSYKEIAKPAGLVTTGWTWNARFNDVNNDGWQDLYTVTGFNTQSFTSSNLLFENNVTGQFIDKTEDYELTYFSPTTASTFLDMDNDGDLDLIAVPTSNNLLLYKNDLQSNRSKSRAIAFQIEDQLGNHSGIATKITIHYGKGLAQIKELKVGGGYLSFDAPIIWFGLGHHDRVQHIDIDWPDGSRTTLKRELFANASYLIKRTATRGDQVD